MKRITAYLLAGATALISGMLISVYRSTGDGPPAAPPGAAADLRLTDYPLTDLDGTVRYLREWRGESVLVNFWATWCAPCREEIPLLQSARDRYRDRGVEVVGVALDEMAPVKAFRDEFAIVYPLLLARDDPFGLLEVSGNSAGALPHTVLLDGEGRAVASHTGILDEALIEELIQAHFVR